MAEDNKEENKTNKLDWNKNDFGEAERFGLRINVHEALQYQAEKGKVKLGELTPAQKKLRKKVIDSYSDMDDDEMDEDVIRLFQEFYISAAEASNGDDSLVMSLPLEERNRINQKMNMDIIRQEENAGKLNALRQSDAISSKIGISKMSRADGMRQMQDAIYNPRRLRRQSLENNIAKKVGLKGQIKRHSIGKVANGTRKIIQVSGNRKVKNIRMQDAEQVGKKKISQNAIAEIILKKSGQYNRLAEIKMRRKLTNKNKLGVKVKRSYSNEMKKLLKEALRKNAKVR